MKMPKRGGKKGLFESFIANIKESTTSNGKDIDYDMFETAFPERKGCGEGATRFSR